MLIEEMRRAVEAAPRVKLAEIGEVMWRAWGQGQLTDAQAEELSALIETRKALPAPEKPAQRRSGSQPRSPASIERRRSWAAYGRLPPHLAARFTPAEQAVMAVVATEVTKRGSCEMPISKIAALAGVGETTVKRALRQARNLGLVAIEERRVSAWRNLPNRITITSAEWASWLRLGPKGGGGQFAPPSNTKRHRTQSWSPVAGVAWAAGGVVQGARAAPTAKGPRWGHGSGYGH